MASQYELSLETPILYLKCEEAFSQLTAREKMFAHSLSRASWWGGLIVLCQTSPESPLLFNLFTRLLRSQPLESLKEIAITKAGFTEDEYNGLLIYCCSLFFNMGNYLGFGDRKFVPSVSKEKLQAFVRICKAYEEAPHVMEEYMRLSLDPLYSLEDKVKFLGLPHQGVTMYFTPNCTEADAELVAEYLTERNIEAWNTRLLKHEKDGKVLYEIRLAAVETCHCEELTAENDVYKGNTFCVRRGDFSFFLGKMIEELNVAIQYVSSDKEKLMLEKYIESFKSGSVKAHKEGSTHWVQNKSPAVETYMGFIEVYRDPTSQRAEFESLVAIVNREQSRKFSHLVSRAEKEFIPLLPWGPDFEEDKFLQPDFTSLDILTYASSGIPIGINIPNYKDIKEEKGFKNVSLGNVMAARTGIKGGPFLNENDHELRLKYGSLALDIQVALHELLGHGCGKFFRRKDDGTLNFDPKKVRNPFTGEEATFYETGQNYNSSFSNLASAYEECRAEVVALYLSTNSDILDIFDVDPKVRSDVKYICWLDMFYAGLKGLEMYQPDQKKWGQAHSQARYVILNVALQHAEGLVTLKENISEEDGLPDLEMTLDRSKIETVGKEAMGDFLRKLQVYRSLNDSVSGRNMFEHYSEVKPTAPYPFEKWHEIVVRKRRPRMILTNPNTRMQGDDVELVSYPDGVEGCVKSWVDRFSPDSYELIEKHLLDFASNWTEEIPLTTAA